jgi:hypothetical protein
MPSCQTTLFCLLDRVWIRLDGSIVVSLHNPWNLDPAG